jgi:hypothetical protein
MKNNSRASDFGKPAVLKDVLLMPFLSRSKQSQDVN